MKHMNMMMKTVRRYRIGKACELLGIERWRLKEMVRKNWVPHSKTDVGNQVLFSIEDIEQIREALKYDAN